MSVVVADAIVRVSADVAGGKAGLADIREEAKATGEQLDALAAKFARAQGGTAADWRPILDRQNLSAKAVQDALGGAAQGAEKVAAGAGKAAAATAEASTAAAVLSKHFDLSAGTLVRAGGALVGVGLGLSAAVGLADKLHDLVVGIAEGQLTWESSLRRTAGLYGDAAAGIVATSAAQSALPDVLGTQQEFLSANLNARYLTSRYGVPEGDVTGLTTAAGRVAKTFGLTDEKARADLQARALAYADAGGNSLREYGIEGDPLTIARAVGLSAPEGLAALTPGQLKRARDLNAQIGLNDVARRGNDQQAGLLDARTALEKQLEQAQNGLRTALEGQRQQATADETTAGRFYGGGAGTPLTPALGAIQSARSGTIAEEGARYAALTAAVDAAKNKLEENAKALADNATATAQATKELEALGVTANSATAHLLQFAGSLEDPHSIARGDIAAQAQAAVGGRAIGPNPRYAQSPAALLAAATESADQQAYQSFVAAQARNGRPSGIQEYLRTVAAGGGPEAAAARAALDEATRRTTGNLAAGVAGQAADLAGRAGTEASGQLQDIQIQQDERRLAVADKLAGYRKDALTTEGQMAPLLLQQATLADRIAVASRDNLETRRQVIAAQQAALPATNALEDLTYGQSVVEKTAQVRQARLIRGQDVSDLPSFDTLISQHVGNALDVPRAELNALLANRPVQLAQRTQTAEGLGRASTLADLEGQGRVYQDLLIPLQEAARQTQAKEDSVSRTLALLDLEDTAATTAAQHRLNEADQLKLEAVAAQRAAIDYAVNLDLGATAAERGQKALELGRDALKEMGGIQNQANEASARIANGLGAGGLGPAAGTPPAGGTPPTLNLTFQISASNVDDVVRQVEAALRRELSDAGTGPPPVSSSLAGARR